MCVCCVGGCVCVSVLCVCACVCVHIFEGCMHVHVKRRGSCCEGPV